MTSTFQTDLTDTRYNGWTNYETWNVALWIQNDWSWYNLANEAGDYQTFVDCLEACSMNDATTGDGVKWNDPRVNVVELNEMFEDL